MGRRRMHWLLHFQTTVARLVQHPLLPRMRLCRQATDVYLTIIHWLHPALVQASRTMAPEGSDAER